jgi:hypothetical protein
MQGNTTGFPPNKLKKNLEGDIMETVNTIFELDPWDENTPDEYQEDYDETQYWENTED